MDIDATKVEYSQHNAGVVYKLQPTSFRVLHSDFLKLSGNFGTEIDAVFLSPPWGGTGYQMLNEYNLEHIFPDFDLIIDKALTYSPNLMLFLPKNTSVTDLTQRLAKFSDRLIGTRRRLDLDRMG